MLHLLRARVPATLLPPELAQPAPDPLDPAILCDLAVDGGRIAAVGRSGAPLPPGARTRDLGGSLTFPGFVDAHVHLDKTHTWTRAPNRSGTFPEALDVLMRDKEHWSPADLRCRAGFALRCAWEHGTRLIRTHVDSWWPGCEPSHATLAELRIEWRGRIELQTVPLTGVANYAGREGEDLADLALRYGASALGGFSLMAPELPRQLDHLLALARDRGVGIDLHVDENGNPQEEVLRAVAAAVLRAEFPHPVVCGHCCSLAVQAPDRQRSTIELVKAAGVRVIALPLCNLYLQGRRAGAFPRGPHWRGLTLLHDLLDAGVPVACASDNVRDAFYAFGDYDAAEVLQASVRLAHLDERLPEAPRVVTAGAAELIGRPDRGRVAPGAPAQLVVFPARTFSELLSRPGSPRHLLEGEEYRAAQVPSYRELS